MSVFGVILVRIFLHLDRIRTRITPNTVTFYAVTVAFIFEFLSSIQSLYNGWFGSFTTWQSMLIEWGIISRDFPLDVSTLTATVISHLVLAVAIALISMSRPVFTLIRTLHYKLRDTCIASWKMTLYKYKSAII